MRRKFTVVVGLLLGLMLGASVLVPVTGLPADAHEVPEDPTDTLGVVTGWSYIQTHTLGPDVLEVWVCRVEGSPQAQAITPALATTVLTTNLVPYYEWLSEGRYAVSFVEAGEVTITGGSPDPVACQDAIAPVAAGDGIASNGAVIAFDVPIPAGLGTTGLGADYPANGRYAAIGVEQFKFVSAQDRWALAHEVGHTLHFGHSFTGKATDINGNVDEYDNIIDVMSGARQLIGTLAYNRYAAGWIDPAQVVVYGGAGIEVALGPIGHAGDQLLVIPGPDPHTHAVIDVRSDAAVEGNYDSVIAKAGVTVHYIDERSTVCGLVPHCSGINRRTEPADGFPFFTSHVYGVGQAFDVFGIGVGVLAESNDVYTIGVGDLPLQFPANSEVALNTLTETAVELSWPAALGADDYTISGGPAPVVVTEPTVVLDGLTPGADYTFSVVAKRDAESAGPLSIDVTTLAPGGSRIGFQNPVTGFWELVESDAGYNGFFYGNPSDLPVACDWDGDGIDTVGLYRPSNGFLYLRNSNTQGPGETEIFYGEPADIPVCGDWDGDGVESIGVYRPRNATFYLRNSNTQGFADIEFIFGNPGDVPFAGDWNGDGIDTVGLYRQTSGFVYITNVNEFGVADFEAFYGNPGDRFVVGDWDGNGSDSFGIYRPSDRKFYLSNMVGQAIADIEISAGQTNSAPIAGIFD